MKNLILCLVFLVLVQWPVFGQNPFDDDADVQAQPAVAIPPEEPVDPGPPLTGTSDEAVDYYGRKFTDPDAAWGESLQDRNTIDPRNIPLRDAEHYWWARAQVQTAPWYLKPYKWFQQSLCTVGYSGYKAARSPFTANTTPPSLREVKYGLKGAWEGLFPPPARAP